MSISLRSRLKTVGVMLTVVVAALAFAEGVGKFGARVSSKLEYAKEVSEEGVLQELPHPPAAGPLVKVPILIYHNIRPEFPGETRAEKSFSMTPEMLDVQLKYLDDNGYTIISMDQLAADVAAATTSVPKPIVLTFDDGWQSQFEYALPLLRAHHDTATFYIFTDAISTNPSYMTWPELIQLQKEGMTIGDHTVSHPRLSGLNSAELRSEILNARSQLEQHLRSKIRHFASPYGYMNADVERILKDNGFETGRTTYKGVYQSSAGLYDLRGYLVKSSMSSFIDYLEGS